MPTTTDLKTLKTDPNSEFTWGKILKFHELGPYTIIEYLFDGGHNFHPYVDGRSLSSATTTLEGAILLAIGHKNLGPNEGRYMAKGACKLLGVCVD
jgi:hypothetical protein